MEFKIFLSSFGILFNVVRDGAQVLSVQGVENHEKPSGRKFIGFMPGTDVKINDILVNPAGDKFYVTDTETSFFQGEPFSLQAFYQTAAEHQRKQEHASVYNIGNAYGSIIGTGNSALINYGNSISQMKERIEQTESPDKEDLSKIISLLEMIVNNQLPPSKGLFSKFSAVMERNSWICGSISSTILGWLMSQIP